MMPCTLIRPIRLFKAEEDDRTPQLILPSVDCVWTDIHGNVHIARTPLSTLWIGSGNFPSFGDGFLVPVRHNSCRSGLGVRSKADVDPIQFYDESLASDTLWRSGPMRLCQGRWTRPNSQL